MQVRGNIWLGGVIGDAAARPTEAKGSLTTLVSPAYARAGPAQRAQPYRGKEETLPR